MAALSMAGVLGILAWHLMAPSARERGQPLSTLFALLQSRGFRANPGLAGGLTPGTLVQIREREASGQLRDLVEPLVVKWGTECLPDHQPQTHGYALPESSGKTSDHLDLAGSILEKEAPALALKNDLVSSYQLRLRNPQLRTLAKGDISGAFSASCVQALDRAAAAGDLAAWHAVVIETLVVEALEYEITWKKATSATARAELGGLVKRNLARALSGAPGQVAVSTKAEDEDRTVLTATADAVVAYRLRPIELADLPGKGANKP